MTDAITNAMAECNERDAGSPRPLSDHMRRVFPRACVQLERVLDRELARDPVRRCWGGREALVDLILELLDLGRVIELKHEIRSLESEIEAGRRRLAGLRRKRISEPAGGGRLLRSEKRLSKKIEECGARIDALQRLRREKMGAIVSEGRSIGIRLDREQVELFLSSVTGETVLHLANLFENVKRIAEQLRTMADESGEDVHTARRYHGMHVMLVLVLARANKLALDGIEGHEERIQDIRCENRRENERARSLEETVRAEDDRALLRSNIHAQAITDEACALHLEQLADQASRLEVAQERLRERYLVAHNTLRTATLAAEFTDIVAAGINTMAALGSMKLPEIAHFRNDMLRERYLEVARLAREGG